MAATVCVQVAQASITVRDVDGATTAREIIERLKSSCNRKGPQVSESNAFGTVYTMIVRFYSDHDTTSHVKQFAHRINASCNLCLAGAIGGLEWLL